MIDGGERESTFLRSAYEGPTITTIKTYRTKRRLKCQDHRWHNVVQKDITMTTTKVMKTIRKKSRWPTIVVRSVEYDRLRHDYRMKKARRDKGKYDEVRLRPTAHERRQPTAEIRPRIKWWKDCCGCNRGLWE